MRIRTLAIILTVSVLILGCGNVAPTEAEVKAAFSQSAVGGMLLGFSKDKGAISKDGKISDETKINLNCAKAGDRFQCSFTIPEIMPMTGFFSKGNNGWIFSQT
jgi:hypothetical protein